MSSAALAYLANALVGGTLLAVATAALCRVGAVSRRPSLVFALWLVVLIRFLVPGVIGFEVPVDGVVGGEPLMSGGVEILVAGSAPAPSSAWSWSAALLVAWAGGAALLLLLATGAALRLRRRIAELPAAAPPVRRRAAELAEAMGMARAPSVRLAEPGEALGAPFAWGLVRPVVVLPRWLEPGPKLDHVLCHELAHLVRRDPLWAVVERLATAALFFWPPLWWVKRRLAAARERACDQLAVSRGRLSPARYASTLVEVSLRGRGLSPAVAMGSPKSQLAARVEGMLAGGGRAGLGALGVVAIAAQIALGLPRALGASPAAGDGAVDCTVAPGVEARILATHPDADTDGDGVLSHSEICAHQLRMQRLVIDAAISSELVEQRDPIGADADGDGVVSATELEAYKEQVEMSFAETDDRSSASLVHGGELLVSSLPVDVEVADAGTFVCTSRARCAEPRAAAATGRPNSMVLIDVLAD